MIEFNITTTNINSNNNNNQTDTNTEEIDVVGKILEGTLNLKKLKNSTVKTDVPTKSYTQKDTNSTKLPLILNIVN